jgi:hypothetical protein
MEQDDRRIYPRYPLRAFAQLDSSNKAWAVHLLDISYTGARIALLDDYELSTGAGINLRLEIPSAQRSESMPPYLYLQGTLVHQQEHMLGIQYEPTSAQDAELLTQILANLES